MIHDAESIPHQIDRDRVDVYVPEDFRGIPVNAESLEALVNFLEAPLNFLDFFVTKPEAHPRQDDRTELDRKTTKIGDYGHGTFPGESKSRSILDGAYVTDGVTDRYDYCVNYTRVGEPNNSTFRNNVRKQAEDFPINARGPQCNHFIERSDTFGSPRARRPQDRHTVNLARVNSDVRNIVTTNCRSFVPDLSNCVLFLTICWYFDSARKSLHYLLEVVQS